MASRNGGERYPWAQTIVFFLVIVVALLGMAELMAWIEQKPMKIGLVFSSLIYLVCLWGFSLSKPRPGPVPEPYSAAIKDALESVGCRWVKANYLSYGQSASFPRPLAFGRFIGISERVLDEFSHEALMWSVKTDALAAFMFIKWGVSTFVAAMLMAVVADGLVERWHLPSVYYWIPLGLGISSFAGLCIFGFQMQVQADKRFTKTEADRLAAKEALSFPYFDQLDRTSSKKWMYPRAELSKRAKRLGIELERGYHVPTTAETEITPPEQP